MARIPRFGLFGSQPRPVLSKADTLASSLDDSESEEEVVISSYLSRDIATIPRESGVLAKRQRRVSPELNGTSLVPLYTATDESEQTEKDTEWTTTEPPSPPVTATPNRSTLESPFKRLRGDTHSEHGSGVGNSRQMKQLQTLYETQRDLYLKHKELADKAAEKMHHAVLMMTQATSLNAAQPGSSGNMSPELVSNRNTNITRAFPYATQTLARLSSSDSSELPDPRTLFQEGLRITSPLSAPVTSDHFQSSLPLPISDAAGAGMSLDLCARTTPKRPYQFTSQLMEAFKLKPRAALTCAFEGLNSEVSVAYGMDGTVQLWSPQERRMLQKLDSTALDMDFAEHVTQVMPSLLVAVSGERTKPDSRRNPGQLMYLNQTTGATRAPRLQNAQQLHTLPESELVAVAEGMMGARTHDDCALMVTGGMRDRKVYVWEVKTAAGRVTAAEKRQLVRTRHTSRISALCFEPVHNYVLSGSDSGRVNVGCAETGREITADNGERVSAQVVGKLAVCPNNPNLVLASMGTTSDQVRLFDIRSRLSIQRPALALGLQRDRTQSRYLRPAWHPHGDLIFYPFLRGSTESGGDGMVAIWDVRYQRCAEDAPQVFHPHKADVWSVSFVESRTAGRHAMVTVSNDHCIGFTDFQL
ncbi:hypothetical protein IWW56_003447 [Coemansia sp. RSA 2131]|nr:hypothetical protein IWW56_003447 [Coemansia sp. RSA 2131]